jgi:trehalose 6-phosphate synthase/phosphatase
VVVERLLSSMAEAGSPPDFVLCVGDDRSDEDMFESIAAAMADPPQSPSAEVIACTVGEKPSKAKYYLDDPSNVLNMLKALAVASDPSSASKLNDFSTQTSQASLEMSSLHI